MERIQMLPLASVPKNSHLLALDYFFFFFSMGLPCLSHPSLGHSTLRKAVQLAWLGLELFVSCIPGPWAALRDKILCFCSGEGGSGEGTFPLQSVNSNMTLFLKLQSFGFSEPFAEYLRNIKMAVAGVLLSAFLIL